MTELTLDQWIGLRTGLGPSLCQETLAQWQRHRLQEQARYAIAHSRFWRQRYAGVDLESPETWPLIDQSDLRNYGQDMLCLAQSQIQRVSTLLTSGSCGAPKRLFFSQQDLEKTIDFFAYGMATLTDRGDRVWIGMNGPTPDSLGDLLARGLAAMGREPILHGECTDLDTDAAALRRDNPHCLVGIPQQVLALARRLPELRPKTVLLSADNVPPLLREEISILWQTQVYAHWGMRETGLGGAVECAAHQGYHIRHADLFLEIIQPNSGQILPPGCRGELVISTLNRQAMPLLRYRTGDLAHLLDGPCPCGSTLLRLGYVEGHKS